jgi:nucleoside recognition membrane protein YjiH
LGDYKIFDQKILNQSFFTRVGTYVQRGSKFCFVVVVVVVVVLLGVTVIAQNIALLANFTMHSAA